MAEIHIQRKRKNFRWLWLIILLLIIAAVFYYLYINNYLNSGNAQAINLNRGSLSGLLDHNYYSIILKQ